MKKLRLKGYAFGVLGTLMVGGTFGCLSNTVPDLAGGETMGIQDVLARLMASAATAVGCRRRLPPEPGGPLRTPAGNSTKAGWRGPSGRWPDRLLE